MATLITRMRRIGADFWWEGFLLYNTYITYFTYNWR
jgi:hypothetical protein